MILITVPGLPTVGKPKLKFASVVERVLPNGHAVMAGPPAIIKEFEHGWPLVYMRRDIGYSVLGTNLLWRSLPQGAAAPSNALFTDYQFGGAVIGGCEIAWTAPVAWPWEASDLSEFHFLPLVIDAVVAIAIVVLIMAAGTSWTRRRGSIWRWRIVDMAVLLTVVALCLGYWKWATVASERDARLATPFISSDPAMRSLYWEYRGPIWLARLIGTRKALAVCDRVVKLHSSATDGTPESWRAIGQLTGLEHLEIAGTQPTEEDFANLIDLPKLRSLAWGDIAPSSLEWLPRLRRLERLVLFNSEVSNASFDRLKRAMPRTEIVLRR